MRKLLLASVVAALAAPQAASATHSPAVVGPPEDFALGGGHHAEEPGLTPNIHFAFSAHSGPLGEDPRGQVQLFYPPALAEVTCLIVEGNQAFITATSETVDGGVIVVHAVDNGDPSDEIPDLLRGSVGAIIPHPERPACFLPLFPPVPVNHGDIVVHDAAPPIDKHG